MQQNFFASKTIAIKMRIVFKIKVNVFSISQVYVASLFNICKPVIIHQYHKILAVFKENELTSSPSILHKQYIFFGIGAITVYGMSKSFRGTT